VRVPRSRTQASGSCSFVFRRNCLGGKSARHFTWGVRRDRPVIFHQRREIRNRGTFKNPLSLSPIFDYADVRVGKNAKIGNAEHDWIAAAACLAVVVLLPRSQVTVALGTTVFGDVHTVRKICLMPNPLADDATTRFPTDRAWFAHAGSRSSYELFRNNPESG